ncbi:hypothetical protein QYE76_058959 [Lolium multiflorum]|uniref:DUF4218 domain-containing protein n=1 Tax=Lolium multiflorum TaxID=4521 RepID=A0AAD8T828_LOLMU|nr:hypothetical protein QYE76_058959 [Lolium multiflorum]
MKSHDCHVLMTQILPVAIRGIMDEHVRDTLFGLCNFFDVITRKSIGVRQLKMLQDEIVVILCELEIYFPPAFCDICVHLLLHVVEDIKQLGPTFLHNMMPFERQNGVMKGYVRNRARPDASMAKGFLTYECISFCQNYLSTEDDEDHVGLPPRTHLGRLAGVGHREGYRSVHVGIENRRDDFDRAHRVALQHLKLIEPFVQEHKSMVEQNYIDMGRPRKMGDVTKKHNSSFTRPAHNLRTYQGYDINGYRFYTEEKDRNSENQNSGVTMLSYADDETNVKERFFGRIEEIWELNYCGETVPMFRVRWAKKVEKEGRYFTTMVIPDAKSKNASAKNEPWVLGSQVDQCFFITDPSRPSRVVVRRGKRSIIGMQGDANEEDLDKNGDPKMEEEFDRHFDMPTTSKVVARFSNACRGSKICGTTRCQGPLSGLGSSRLFVLLNHCPPVGFGSKHSHDLGQSSNIHVNIGIRDGERNRSVRGSASEHKKKYDELKAICGELIGFFEKTRSPASFKDQISAVLRDQFGILPKKKIIGYSKPYPNEFDLIPLPPKYRLPDFTKFSGSEGSSSIEHVSRYLAQLGMVSASDQLRVRFFSQSLTGPAFGWYTSLQPNSVRSWKQLEEQFHTNIIQKLLKLVLPN